MTLILVLCLIFFILLSAFTSSSETALFSLSSMKVKSMRQSPNSKAKMIAHLLANPRKLLVTLIMLNILVNILVQNTVSSIFGIFSGWLLAVGLPLVLTLIFGEMIPKSLAILHSDKIAFKVAPFLFYFEKVLGFIPDFISKIAAHISRFMFFFLSNEKEISVDELKHTLQASKDSGVLGEDEVKVLTGVLHLSESKVKDFMRPRLDILFFDLKEPISKLIHLFVDQECTRIPVCDGKLEELMGIVTSRLFFLYRQSIKETKDLLPFLKKPFFVPETTDAKALLQQFYQKKESIALVVDEYGSISGIISIEDLVEVVVGEIADRRDEKNLYTQSAPDTIIASGKMELVDLEEMFHVPFISKNNMMTIGGWLTEQLGDIPKSGVRFQTDFFLFHILSADPTRVTRVYIRYKKGGKK